MKAGSSATRHALVTGASSGIGAAFARRLARERYHLTIVARRERRLEELRTELEPLGVTVRIVVTDLTSHSLREVEKLIQDGPPLDLLVNNAGVTQESSFLDSRVDHLEQLLLLHCIAPLRLTRAALPLMIQRGQGAIINVSSAAGFVPEPDVYSSSKAFLTAFTHGLAAEIRGSGVRLQALCPGWTRSEIFIADIAKIPDAAFMTAEDVVQASLSALALGEVICLPCLEDASVVDAIMREEDKLLERVASTGKLASRYVVDPA
jgi:short-subunit dehydrogenase